MNKFDLIKNGNSVIRVLDIQSDKVLIIDCVKRTMPIWVQNTELESYTVCDIDELNKIAGSTESADILDAMQRKVMHERYTLIASVLPFIADNKARSSRIRSAAENNGLSKQTVRNYLCLYLAYMDTSALAPHKHKTDNTLTQDEKNMRWALNKFFYTTKKHSLNAAYTMMLKEKYCDNTGALSEKYPTFHQFRYFYRKTKNMQNFYISRDGLKSYQRNNRPLTGEGVQESV